LLIGEVLELESDDLGTDVCREMDNVFRCGEQCLLVRIGTCASVGEVTVVVSDSVDILQIERPGRSILSRRKVTTFVQ